MKYPIIWIIVIWSNIVFAQSKVEEDTCSIFVSNVLTRNDGDELIINSGCELIDFNFEIYNKWGELMYQSNHFQSPMDFDLYEKIVVDGEEKYKFPKKETFIWVMTYKRSMQKSEGLLIKKSDSITIL